MEKTAEIKVCASVYCFKPLLLLVHAIFVPCLVITCVLTVGFSPCLVTIPILFLSTLFIVTFWKKKVIVVQNPPQGDASPLSCPNSLVEEGVGEKPNIPEFETVSHNSNSAAQQSQVCCMHDEYQVETTDFPSDSESSDDFLVSETLELSWVCSNNEGQNVAISDSSVSDDDDDDDEQEDGDDLIEISLPKNSSADLNSESKQKLQSDLPQSIFKREGLLELLADINEANEENLIEIDLSMGSIKCSTFQIEA